jgi:hypothetical protein
MTPPVGFDVLKCAFERRIDHLPDHRKPGPNTRYRIKDAALGAFSVFYMQLPSFLAHQKHLQHAKGQNNARTLFGVEDILHCPNCLSRQSSKGQTRYYHTAITPVIVCPGRSEVIALPPEFIMPQDGHDKQDCERVAGKRWIDKHARQIAPHGVTLLGDDLYSNQPLCECALKHGFQQFSFLCSCGCR